MFEDGEDMNQKKLKELLEKLDQIERISLDLSVNYKDIIDEMAKTDEDVSEHFDSMRSYCMLAEGHSKCFLEE